MGASLVFFISPRNTLWLVLRLSRVRKNDPTLRLEEMELQQAQRLGSGHQGLVCDHVFHACPVLLLVFDAAMFWVCGHDRRTTIDYCGFAFVHRAEL